MSVAISLTQASWRTIRDLPGKKTERKRYVNLIFRAMDNDRNLSSNVNNILYSEEKKIRNIITINYFRNNEETKANNKYQGRNFDYITKTREKLNNRRYTVR